jgi:hypothetical protein
MRCSFCDLEATSTHRIFKGEALEENNGILGWDYYGEAIYTCGRHSLMHTEFDMDGEPVKRVISE